jgi:protein disulfide-isomerase A1
MKQFKEFIFAATSLLAAVAYAEDVVSDIDSDVTVLQKDTFESFVGDHPLVLAEFYAPWCGHCKALAPEYESAATLLKEKNIQLAKIDCTVEAELCEKQGVQGYPTLKVFRGPDSSTPYSGQRKADSIVSYMIKQYLPAVSVLGTDDITEFKKAEKFVLIAYFDTEDKDSNNTFSAAAESLRDTFLFGATSDPALAEADGVKMPAIVLYKTFDEGKDNYEGKFDITNITSFAKAASTPLIGEVGPDTYSGYMAAGIPLAYLFVDNEEIKEKLVAAIRPIAIEYKTKINFATIDAVAFGAHAANLNLESKWPAFAIQETVKNQKFPFDQEEEITQEAIAQFVKNFVEGKIAPSIKSEPIPETQEGPVHVVVANNFEDIVIKNEKDVLVEFYAPWCGHCKNLAPKYEELAKLYFDNPEYADKVIVAKVDATSNDVPVDIQGFPTIKLYPSGAKDSPVDYAGARTVEDLANFIKANGAYKIDAYIPPPPEHEEDDVTDAGESLEEAAAAATENIKLDIDEASQTVLDADKEQDHDEL